jgi:hypothetical protein
MGVVAFIVTAPFAKPLRIQMSALGQKQTLHVRATSALPPKADMDHNGCDIRFVPQATSVHADHILRRPRRLHVGRDVLAEVQFDLRTGLQTLLEKSDRSSLDFRTSNGREECVHVGRKLRDRRQGGHDTEADGGGNSVTAKPPGSVKPAAMP